MILKYSFLAGAAYFFFIFLFHILGIKIPGFFIYYDIPSYQYQDQIISFLAFGWSLFFYAASKIKEVIPFVLVSCFVALLSLANINSSTDFYALSNSANSTPFWIQTAILLVYVSWLTVFYLREK